MTIPRAHLPVIALLGTVALGALALLLAGHLMAMVGLAGLLAFLAAPLYVLVDHRTAPPLQLRVRPPGLPLIAFVLVALALLSVGALDRWGSSSTSLLLGGFLIWCVAGLLWIGKLLFACTTDGLAGVSARWRRWLLPPLVGVLGLAFAVSVPFQIRVELSRPAMDDTARRIESRELRPGDTANLGLFGNRSAQISDEGFVEFDFGESEDLVTKSWLSLVWIPPGTADPVDGGCVYWTHFDGRWWMRAQDEFCSL